MSKAPGSPHFLTAAGPWLTPTWGRAGGAGSRLSGAWGVRPLGAPRFQRRAPLHGAWYTLVRKPLKQSSGLRAAENARARLPRAARVSWLAPPRVRRGGDLALLGGPQTLWALPRADRDRASRHPELRATGSLSRLCLSGGVTGEMAGGPPPHTCCSACFFPHRLSGPKPVPHGPGCPRRFCRRLVACWELG